MQRIRGEGAANQRRPEQVADLEHLEGLNANGRVGAGDDIGLDGAIGGEDGDQAQRADGASGNQQTASATHFDRVVDVGVAGPQRLLRRVHELQACDAIVVVAGMEGALPSVVGGHVACPIVAVPTSVGYGANLGGMAALLAMLNSCAANVTVVNIDAGFKAGYVAGLIATRLHAARNESAHNPTNQR